MLIQNTCNVSLMTPKLGGLFCDEKAVVGFLLKRRGFEIDPATFNKTALDTLVQEEKLIGSISFFNAEDNDEEASYSTSITGERTKIRDGIKRYRFMFDKGSCFQNELNKLDNSSDWEFIPVFEDGKALFAVKKDGKLIGFDAKLFTGTRKLKLTDEMAGPSLEVEIQRTGMTYWQNSSGVYESDEFGFNELSPVAGLNITFGVLTAGATTTVVTVTNLCSDSVVTGLTTANSWKMNRNGVLETISAVSFNSVTQKYTLTHTALVASNKVSFLTSENGINVVAVDTNYYSGVSDTKTVA